MTLRCNTVDKFDRTLATSCALCLFVIAAAACKQARHKFDVRSSPPSGRKVGVETFEGEPIDIELPSSVSGQHVVNFNLWVDMSTGRHRGREGGGRIQAEMTLPVHLRYPDPGCERRGEDCDQYAWVKVNGHKPSTSSRRRKAPPFGKSFGMFLPPPAVHTCVHCSFLRIPALFVLFFKTRYLPPLCAQPPHGEPSTKTTYFVASYRIDLADLNQVPPPLASIRCGGTDDIGSFSPVLPSMPPLGVALSVPRGIIWHRDLVMWGTVGAAALGCLYTICTLLSMTSVGTARDSDRKRR